MPNIYGDMETAQDVTDINKKIRKDVKKAKKKPELTELYNRSKYLYTLTFSPTVKKNLNNVMRVRRRTKEEFHKTARAIQRRADNLGIKADYDTKIGRGR